MEPKEPLGPPELPKAAKQASTATPEPEEALQASAVDDDPDQLNDLVENPGDPDGVVADEEEQKWQAEHPAPAPSPLPERRKRRWPVVLLTVVIIAGATYGAYWFGNKQADKNKPAATKTTQTTTSTKTAEQQANVPTKHYDSTIYTLGFDYPQTWTVADTASKLTVTSPATSLATTSGTNTKVHVVVTIQNPQATIAGYPASGAVAALLSSKLTYKQPSAVQRAQTYLSFVGYTSANSLDALYITGDNGYQQGQQIPMSDVAKGNPLISVTFVTCTSADCATGTPTPVTLQASKWNDTAADKQVTDLLQSIILD